MQPIAFRFSVVPPPGRPLARDIPSSVSSGYNEIKAMDTKTSTRPPEFPSPVPNFSDEINRNIIQSEIEGGVHLNDLPEGAKLEVRTENRAYQLVNCGGRQMMIAGHPEFCPKPVRVQVHGSSWGGSMLKVAFIGRGMHLEFRHPEFNTVVTSRIVEIRDVA